MTSKEITYIFLAFIAILGWNAFLIKRDDEMYKAYYRQTATQHLTQQQRFCASQKQWHPDCAPLK